MIVPALCDGRMGEAQRRRAARSHFSRRAFARATSSAVISSQVAFAAKSAT